ncbi:hypothetical protein I552_4926 [Mycobacterium xenopi 3993]|nr:hypothetical protein I552_4926 [Mycobacterium xenopi 3993]
MQIGKATRSHIGSDHRLGIGERMLVKPAIGTDLRTNLW